MRILLFGILAIVCFSCKHKPRVVGDCSKYREGVFRMVSGGITDTLIRSGAFQTERVDGKMEFTFDVKWLDSCSFTLTPTQRTVIKYSKMHRDQVVTVEILKTTDSSYTQRVTSTANDELLTGEVYRVKPKFD